MWDYGKRWVSPFQYPVVRFSSCTFRVSVPIIYDWYLQWVQFVSHPDRSWSPLTDCTGPIWLQESWTLVSALIHFHPLFWILLYRPGGCIADLLVLNSISWPYETVLCVCVLSLAQPFATPWTVALQAPLSMELSRQGYWSGVPFPSPRDLPNPGIKPQSSALQADFFTVWATREAFYFNQLTFILGPTFSF